MREIRFRLWDKENKKMIVRDSLYTYFIGLLGDIGRHDVCGNATYNNGYKFYSEQFELMQYTGLRDKNGVEIYEGDVVTSPYREEVVGQVVYGKYHDNGDLDGPVDFAGFYVRWSDGSKSYVDLVKYQVISNIFDNPELLAANKSSE